MNIHHALPVKKHRYFLHYVRFLLLLSVASLCLVMSGCSRKTAEAKLNFEEAGYLSEIESIKSAIESVGTDWVETSMVPTPVGPVITTGKTLQYRHLPAGDWAMHKSKVMNVIPPVGMELLHEQLIKIINCQIGISASRKPTTEKYEKDTPVTADISEVMNLCAVYKSLYEAFDKSVAARPTQTVKSDTLNLYYKTPVLPISASLSENGFKIEIIPEGEITTKYGTVGISKKPFSGIRKLTIISGSRKRCFLLDRPFSLFVPTQVGFQLNSDGKDEMNIQIMDK